MRKKVQINDNSIKTAGLPSDYKEAIAEFVWNGFDAGATEIKIDFDTTHTLKHISEFTIADNGEGINHGHLDRTFGAFLDSEKKRKYQRSSYSHGQKGKGRFSFQSFAHKAVWETVYSEAKQKKKYSITIEGATKDYFNSTTPELVEDTKVATGTAVIFTGITGVTASELESDDFMQFLRYEFGWFLHLNRYRNFKLLLNGKVLDYDTVIADSEETDFEAEDSQKTKHTFKINYIRWNNKIGERFYYYFLNTDKVEQAKRLTSFNNKADEFFHSVYIESDYFNGFVLDDVDENQPSLIQRNHSDDAYKALYKHLVIYLAKKRKEFVRKNSAKLIQRFEDDGVMPKFNDNEYGQERKRDFVTVVKELYSVEPKIFINLGEEQKKSLLGMLNLLLDTDERENILKIIDGIVHDLSKEDRESLANVLKKTSLTKIVRTIKLVERRYDIIALLKTLVFELQKFTLERKHLQQAVQENYWLFGEQYNLVSADESFQAALSKYLYILDGAKQVKGSAKLESVDSLRRPDVFICQKLNLPDSEDADGEIENNIIVELKKPGLVLTKKELRQVEDYLDFIIKQPEFNGHSRYWKFILVGNSYDDDIKKQFDAFKDRGKRHLVRSVDKYEIFVMTWDDVFRTFDVRHRYLLDKLEFDKKAIEAELDLQGIELSRQSSQEITDKILAK